MEVRVLNTSASNRAKIEIWHKGLLMAEIDCDEGLVDTKLEISVHPIIKVIETKLPSMIEEDRDDD